MMTERRGLARQTADPARLVGALPFSTATWSPAGTRQCRLLGKRSGRQQDEAQHEGQNAIQVFVHMIKETLAEMDLSCWANRHANSSTIGLPSYATVKGRPDGECSTFFTLMPIACAIVALKSDPLGIGMFHLFHLQHR